MIIRAHHDANNRFFLVRRATAQDRRLTSRARGVLCFLLSKHDGWEVNVKNLTDEFPDLGRDAAYNIIAELIRFGYAARRQERDALTGKVGPVICDIYEMPRTGSQDAGAPLPDLPDTDLPDTGSPDTAKPENMNKQSAREKQSSKEKQSSGSKQMPRSAHALETIKTFVRATKPHAKNPGGLAHTLWQSGEEDKEISAWLNPQAQANAPVSIDEQINKLSREDRQLLISLAKQKQPEELTDWEQTLLRQYAA